MSSSDPRWLAEHLFRHHAGMMTATLTRIFGLNRLDLVEEVVQDALVRALETWPFAGVPDRPSAWLVQAAKRRAIDLLRHEAIGDRVTSNLLDEWRWTAADPDPVRMSGEIADDVLRLLLLCCHPSLPAAARGPLALHLVAGFTPAEIAAGLFANPTAIAQRIVRAKRTLREEGTPVAVPADAELWERLDSLLPILYLWFSEGYLAHGGAELVRHDVAEEAVRLCHIVTRHPQIGLPKSHALLALMLFHAARFPARTDDHGDLVPLADQDRGRWDRAMLARAFHHLEQSADGHELTTYHLEAGIAACHARAPSLEETDFVEIVELYDALYRLEPSPLVAFHRASARSRLGGPHAAIEEIEVLAADPRLRDHHLVPAALGHLYEELADWGRAADCYRRAMALDCSEPERRLLDKKLARVSIRASHDRLEDKEDDR